MGCDRKFLWPSVGLSLVLIGTRWSPLASLGKTVHRQHLTEEVRGAESILRAKAAILRQEALEISSGGAGASYREIPAKPAEWCSVGMMAQVAALAAERFAAEIAPGVLAGCVLRFGTRSVLALTRKGLIQTVGDRARSSNSGHIAALQTPWCTAACSKPASTYWASRSRWSSLRPDCNWSLTSNPLSPARVVSRRRTKFRHLG